MYYEHLKFHLLSSHLSASAAIRIAITIAKRGTLQVRYATFAVGSVFLACALKS